MTGRVSELAEALGRMNKKEESEMSHTNPLPELQDMLQKLGKGKPQWESPSYRHHVLADAHGKVLATVTGTHPPGHYMYRGDEYTSLEAAKRAAERDHQ